MVVLETKKKVKSRCGINCEECHFKKENTCKGCTFITKPFWAAACPVKDCCEERKLKCCGECSDFPCELLKSFAYDQENGDNGLRIENCQKWCLEEE